MFAETRNPGGPDKWLGAVISFAGGLGLYRLTLAPTVYNLDSAEFSAAAHSGGLVRATGYPLYLLLGRIWTAIPLGDVGFRMNLFSAVSGALTLALAYLILRRLRVGGWAAFGALGLLACSRYFWGLSLIAEVYTLHTALMCGVILLVLRWSDRPSTARLALATGFTGLAAGHHMATVLLAPACLWYVLRVEGWRALRLSSLAACAVALAAGLSIYLYLPWLYLQDPAFNYAGTYDAAAVFHPVDLTEWSGLWWLISGRAFAGQMLAYGPGGWAREISHYAGELWQAFIGIGLGPGILGAIVVWRNQRKVAELLLGMYAVNVLFYVGYSVLDKDLMFLPSYLIWSLWVGVGYQVLLGWIEEARPWRGVRPVVLRQTVLASIVAVVVFSLTWTFPLVDLSRDGSARLRGELVLRVTQRDGLLAGFWETVPLVEYLQIVEGRRPDLLAINRFLISPEDLQSLVRNQLDKRPIYLGEPAPELFPDLQARERGPIYELLPKPLHATPPGEVETSTARP